MTENGISVSKTVRWVSYVVSALPVLMLAFSATLKFIKPPGFNEGIEHLGWTEGQMFGLGVLEFAVAAVYLVPRTAVLGAILIAAYMGGPSPPILGSAILLSSRLALVSLPGSDSGCVTLASVL